MMLAYVSALPLFYLGGLAVFIPLALIACRSAEKRFGRGRLLAGSVALYTGLFLFFLTETGPFVGREERREYRMAWEVRPPAGDGKESEVVLSFVRFPGHHVGEYSGELANHLRTNAAPEVTARFEVTLDYGRVRGFHMNEVAGLRDWRSEWGYAGVIGSPETSPWD